METDNTLVAKVTCLVLFGVIALLCGLLPLIVAKLAKSWTRKHKLGKTMQRVRARMDLVMSCILCVGGGVLLATVFTHMTPEIREIFQEIEGAGLMPDMDLPTGEIFICAGFFLIYFIEELVHSCLLRQADGGKSRKREEAEEETAPPAAAAGVVPLQIHGDVEATAWNDNLYRAASKTTILSGTTAASSSEQPVHQHASPHEHDHMAELATLHAFRAYVVILALSVHSVFEGFAVAFEKTAKDVWLLFAAIVAHKAIVAFCLGEQMLATKRSACFVITNICILAAASPLGVGIGILVERFDDGVNSRLITTGVLQALAAGTIVYVVFFEILGPERQKKTSGLIKFLAVLGGFVLMVIVQISGGHSHSHGHGGAHGGLASHHGHHDHHDHHGHHDAHYSLDMNNTDYLARVQNEAGHVIDTVRYINSFSSKPTNVDEARIVNNMIEVVRKIAGHPEHSHNGEEHSHGGRQHHHDHNEFMRTVQLVARKMGEDDERALNKTLALIDSLDLLATRARENGTDSEYVEPKHPSEVSHQHHADHDHSGHHHLAHHDHGDHHHPPGQDHREHHHIPKLNGDHHHADGDRNDHHPLDHDPLNHDHSHHSHPPDRDHDGSHGHQGHEREENAAHPNHPEEQHVAVPEHDHDGHDHGHDHDQGQDDHDHGQHEHHGHNDDEQGGPKRQDHEHNENNPGVEPGGKHQDQKEHKTNVPTAGHSSDDHSDHEHGHKTKDTSHSEVQGGTSAGENGHSHNHQQHQHISKKTDPVNPTISAEEHVEIALKGEGNPREVLDTNKYQTTQEVAGAA